MRLVYGKVYGSTALILQLAGFKKYCFTATHQLKKYSVLYLALFFCHCQLDLVSIFWSLCILVAVAAKDYADTKPKLQVQTTYTTMSLSNLLLFAFILVLLAYRLNISKRFHQTKIKGAYVVPGYPLIGNTFQVLYNPSQVFLRWARKYKCSIFVIHLGAIPIVVVNSHQDTAILWKSHSVSLGSRPSSYTFHNIVSTNQGLTIGTTPAGESFRKMKKSISSCLSSLRVSSIAACECIDTYSKCLIKHVLIKHKQYTSAIDANSSIEVSLLKSFQYYILSCALLLAYGFEIEAFEKDKALADNIVETENQIIRLRSLISNYHDYLPVLNWKSIRRYFDLDAKLWSLRRDDYMKLLRLQFEERLQANHSKTKASILASIISGKGRQKELTNAEVQSVCLSLVSAGLDNTSLMLDHILGQLSYPRRGYAIQTSLYEALLDGANHSVMQAWQDAAQNMTCDYALAVIEEALRFFTVLPLSLPRKTTKDIVHGDLFIPSGTIVMMNAFEANHDSSVFELPYDFLPERWLDEETNEFNRNKFSHFTFGAGSRMCSGDNLAIKEIYTMLCRIILIFKVKSPFDKSKRMSLDPFEGNACPSATSFEPKEFYVRLQERKGEDMYELRKYIFS